MPLAHKRKKISIKIHTNCTRERVKIPHSKLILVSQSNSVIHKILLKVVIT